MSFHISNWVRENVESDASHWPHGPVYPFRHVEYRLLCLTLFACVPGLFGYFLVPRTLGGVPFVFLCVGIAVVAAFIVWRLMLSRYDSVMDYIVQGKKRMVYFAIEFGVFLAIALAAFGLIANRYIHIGPVRYVDADVVEIRKWHGRSGFLWYPQFRYEGKQYSHVVSGYDEETVHTQKNVTLGLQKGVLGYDRIVTIHPRASK